MEILTFYMEDDGKNFPWDTMKYDGNPWNIGIKQKGFSLVYGWGKKHQKNRMDCFPWRMMEFHGVTEQKKCEIRFF